MIHDWTEKWERFVVLCSNELLELVAVPPLRIDQLFCGCAQPTGSEEESKWQQYDNCGVVAVRLRRGPRPRRHNASWLAWQVRLCAELAPHEARCGKIFMVEDIDHGNCFSLDMCDKGVRDAGVKP
jgi:hypothetical protein